MYAIQNIRTGKWLYGTDYRYNPPHQFTSFDQAMTWETYDAANYSRICRKCGEAYRVVKIKIVEDK